MGEKGRKCSVRAIFLMSALYEILSKLTHAPNVVYVVNRAIKTGTLDVDFKNKLKLVTFSVSIL